jgi:hypothetical protein
MTRLRHLVPIVVLRSRIRAALDYFADELGAETTAAVLGQDVDVCEVHERDTCG